VITIEENWRVGGLPIRRLSFAKEELQPLDFLIVLLSLRCGLMNWY